jgi:predicted DNA-binding transcriptional regulator YafY
MARSGPMPFDAAARTALHKVAAAMSAAGRSGAADLLARIHLLHARRELAAGPVVRAVEQAVIERRVLCLDYRDKHGQPTLARRVEPLGFVGAERDWYLVGRCHLRDAVRVFRLDRITTVEVTTERSSEPVPPAALDDGCPAERSWHPAIVA